jgi:hypothetical protein
MHQLFIRHNGKDDKRRPDTLRLLNLINANISILRQLDVKMKIYIMTDKQIELYYNIFKEHNIKEFPSLIIPDQSDPIDGYDDIYNVYNNEINRIKQLNGNTDYMSGNAGGNTGNKSNMSSISDADIESMDGMDYIMSAMGNPDDDKSEEGGSTDEAMSAEDIKKGMSKYGNKSKNITTKFDTTTNTVEKAKLKEKLTTPGNDEMEDMMMQRMMENAI